MPPHFEHNDFVPSLKAKELIPLGRPVKARSLVSGPTDVPIGIVKGGINTKLASKAESEKIERADPAEQVLLTEDFQSTKSENQIVKTQDAGRKLLFVVGLVGAVLLFGGVFD